MNRIYKKEKHEYLKEKVKKKKEERKNIEL